MRMVKDTLGICASTVRPTYVVTSIKESPVFGSYHFEIHLT